MLRLRRSRNIQLPSTRSYLKVLRQELVFSVLVHAPFEGSGCLGPLHAVGELG